MAVERDIWMIGVCGRVDEHSMPLVSSMLEKPLTGCYYLLGCCLFFHKDFIKKLLEIDFFNRFLNLTNGFEKGCFPSYEGYDISEHMYPTLCRHFGGNIGVLSSYDESGEWHGSAKYFPVRWRPDIDESDPYKEASILHPLKEYSSPVRDYHRKIRKQMKKKLHL